MSLPLSLTGRRWLIGHKKALKGADVLPFLQKSRNIGDASGSLKLSDPFLFPEMEKAVGRIKKAMTSGETIGIFGDYDADGITGVAQLVRYFRRHGTEVIAYLPHRAEEGYGLRRASIDSLKTRSVSLVITVDTGITSHEEIEYAKTLGIDVIVTDHHHPRSGRPGAFAVIHPRVPSEFPNTHLCGSGVAFMLVRALEGGGTVSATAGAGGIWEGIEEDIVLAMIGTIGDLVPLTGENRLLVIQGLKLAAKLQPSPLKDLMSAVRSPAGLTSGDIAFRIVPRINAAGRMSHPELALRALLEGGEALQELHGLNADRQSLVAELTEHAEHSVDTSVHFLVVIDERFTPGTVGLIASRLSEKYGKPSLVAALRDGICMASLRSVSGVDVTKCLSHEAVAPLLLSYGGHAQAAGCTFKEENAGAITEGLALALIEQVDLSTLVPTLLLDAELDPATISLFLARALQGLEPFGSGFKEPMFLLPAQKLSALRTVGSEKSHLQGRVGDLKSVGFSLGPLLDKLSQEKTFDLACRIGIDSWSGHEEAQLFIEDIRESKSEI